MKEQNKIKKKNKISSSYCYILFFRIPYHSEKKIKKKAKKSINELKLKINDATFCFC